jgi:hypothetical protein
MVEAILEIFSTAFLDAFVASLSKDEQSEV